MFEFCILRHRANTGDVSSLSKGSSGLPDTKEYSKDDLKTPTKRHGSDDSGYLSPIRNSDTDPDW